MALRNQPYFPLYIQDFLTDEKLNECSAASTGIYIRIMCLMHKSDDYGRLLLKEKYKVYQSKQENFALMLERVLPYKYDEVLKAVTELLSEGVLYLEGEFICQKRMMKDNDLSDTRRKSGQKGGNAAPSKSYNKPGFIYLASDEKKHKIGLSKDPEKRVLSIRSQRKLPYLNLIDSFQVSDMGACEDQVMSHFKNCIDGEWLICDYDFAVKEFSKIKKAINKAKTKANAENEIVIDIEDNIENKSVGENLKKYVRDETLEKSILTFFGFTESKNPDKQSLVFQFCTSLNNSDHLENFKHQFANYAEYKALTGFKHSFANFTGDQSELFFNGAWNSENWELKLAEAKAKPAPGGKTSFPAYYDKFYEASLKTHEEQKSYWKHLRDLKWTTYRPETGNDKGKVVWLAPGQQSDTSPATSINPVMNLASKFKSAVS